MRVKRLEIQGFKSFKDKTVVHFDHGITGIVGPNGCGKSNIVDAFFWVMGEQSYKHMRGSSSDDLIFNGSSKYSPLGIAEATLVLETDVPDTANAPSGATAADLPIHLRAKEVAVTRRLYRDGQGEYFINGIPARLKDIQELFMDTGVGAKGYSVIEQGQIGKIVNSKPEDRRLLVEEAAGIAKYKARKKESLRKMEATSANLARLTDVIQEIERGMASLERQAQKARQYQRYKAELLDKELTWGRRRYRVLSTKQESARTERERLEQELAGMRAELQTAENAIETERVSQLGDTQAAEERQAAIQKLSDELTREKSALDLSRRRQGDLASQLAALSAEREQLASGLAAAREVATEQEQGASLAAQEWSGATERAAGAEKAARDARAESDTARQALDRAKREQLRGITESSDLASLSAALLARMESARAQRERLGTSQDEAAGREADARARSEEVARTRDELRTRLEARRAEKRAQVESNQQAEQGLRGAEKERDTLARELMQAKSRLQSLQELADSHEGMADATKAALDWARESGVELTAIADQFDTDAETEIALEAWLDSAFQNLVSPSGDTALSAIAQVRDAKQGRIRVLAGSPGAANVSADARSALAEAGIDVLGELSARVRTQSAWAQTLLQGAWVISSWDGVSLTDAQLTRLRGIGIVSLDGTVLDRDGSFRGGSRDTSGASGILRRKRQIQELAAQVAELEGRVSASEAAALQLRESLELARARAQTLASDVQALEVELAGLERDVAADQRALQEASRQLTTIRSEIASLESDIARSESQRAEAQSKLDAILAARSGAESEIAELEARASALQAALAARESEYQALRLTEVSARERSQSLKRELEGTLSLAADRERRIAEIDRTLQRASQEREQHSGGEGGLEQRIAELTASLGTEREALSVIKDRLEHAAQTMNATLERVKELRRATESRTERSTQMLIELEKTSGEVAHLVQNLEEKYGVGCLAAPSPVVPADAIQDEMAAPVVTVEMSAEEELALGEEVERLRERIRRLGEVNVMAVEEFEEAQKRYEHLAGERADLERSMVNLQDAIDHINKTSEDRFKKAFEAIAERFERLFPVVFGGGSAKLSLVYPEGSTDILDAGVDILAQPPGKKVSNIGLLSGGEKALTAVSLIFAIFMVKPSPFCVLDEVDAPLDDANIGKFNALLREMSAKSQFIVITHNKKTMELNDALYGVTMEEPGVSKMVSIELR